MAVLNIYIVGGTGFIGSHLSYRLAALGHRVQVLTRRPERHREFSIGERVRLLQVNPYDATALADTLQDADCVINLAGILNEAGSSRFSRVHVELPRTLVKVMRDLGLRRLLHMSALNANVNENHSRYLKTKGEGENLVHQSPGIDVTSFQPSVVFGQGDSFFNRFAALLNMTPGPLFPLACAGARFAPVYVGDLVDALVHALDHPETSGQRLELCGPQVYTLKQLVDYTASLIDKKVFVIGLPDFVARLQGHLLGLVPGKPFTIDNYYSLKKDSVCNRPALALLGITPHSLEAIVPGYMGTSGSRARYYDYRARSRRHG